MAKKRRRDRDGGTELGSSGAQKSSRTGGRGSANASGTAAAMPSVPKWLPATLFLGLTLLLFREFIFGGQMMYGGDTIGAVGYVARELYAEAIRAFGTIPR